MSTDAAGLALGLYQAALGAVDPRAATCRAVAALGLTSPCHVLAAGKASVPMARGALDALTTASVDGVVVVRQGQWEALGPLQVLEADHPVPTQRSAAAGRALLAAAAAAHGTVVALWSGGGSSLLATPLGGLTTEDLAAATTALLASGAPIASINTVRAALSATASGRIAQRMSGAGLVTLVVSDVASNDPRTIASGPTSEPADLSGAARIAVEAGLADHLIAWLRAHAQQSVPSGPWGRAQVVLSVQDALQAAADEARRRGHRVVRAAPLQGEASVAGARFARRLLALPPRTVLIGGGETTVTLKDPSCIGQGGRCQEAAVAAALVLRDIAGPALLLGSTDGSDGPNDAAGARVDGQTVRRAATDARAALDRHDSYTWLQGAGALLRTGATHTNVTDVWIGVQP